MTQPKRKSPPPPAKPPKPSQSVKKPKRLAYVCYKCEIPQRKFVTDTSKPPPRCGTHGVMVLQANHPYLGKTPG